MRVHGVLLGLHVGAGVAGLVLGPLALAAPTRGGWHTHARSAYQGAVATMTSTALGLMALAPGRLGWLAPIAVATEAAALAGLVVRRRAATGWLPRQLRLMAGSYLALVTAALVVSLGNPLAWVLPTVIGTPLIEAAVKRAQARGLPADGINA